MAKKTNCRSCKWATWSLSEAGRKQYGNWAECTAPVPELPASRIEAAQMLKRTVGVREHKDVKLECAAWVAAPNAQDKPPAGSA